VSESEYAMKKKRWIFLALLILFSISYLWYIFLAPAKNSHGIILISLDTLRADHLGIYGYPRDTSPSIDTLAKESVVFENAMVQAPWTLPSHMSIMTSLYPSFHGVVNKSSRLADEHVTLAELLQQGGYQTAAFTDGGLVSGSFGFDQGFDVYEDDWAGIEKILPKAKKWLDKNKSKPFFLFIHCYDIHDPYNPPPPYNSIFHDFTYSGPLVPSGQKLLAARKRKLKVTNEDLRHFIALYDGGIRYVDDKIGDFFSYLRDSELYDSSLIIITSDHGEEFEEHGSFLHWQLYYEPNLHVPLIMHIPNYPERELRISERVQSIDLLPTIVDLAGLTTHPEAQGRSLLPLIKGNENLPNNPAPTVSQETANNYFFSFAETEINNINVWSAITTSGYQLISYPKSHELFNLESDPVAKINIAHDRGDIIKRVQLHYNELYSTKPDYTSSAIELEIKTRKQLEALGYIDPEKHTTNNATDTDSDGIVNDEDNCPNFQNPHQEDADGDGLGNDCDSCPHIANPGQKNRDEDWVGDACDECIDTDWDGYGNPGYPNTCDADNCPYIFNPDQKDSDSNGIGDACEDFLLMNHWIEAEEADTIAGQFEVDDDPMASQGRFIYTPNGKEIHFVPDTTIATYTVNIVQPGEYVLWGRVKALNGQDDSFFVQIDNGVNNLWDLKTGDFWQWDVVSDRKKTAPKRVILTKGTFLQRNAVSIRKKADPKRFILAKGPHTITIKLREDGTKLDKLLLTNNRDLVPSSTGGSTEE